MSVTTITIRVDESSGAAMSTGVEASPAAVAQLGEAVAADAPPPTLLGGPGRLFAEGVAAEEVAGAAEGPGPLQLEELGSRAASGAEAFAAGPPPEDLVEASESEAVETLEPMPIEDLEKAAKPARSTKKT